MVGMWLANPTPATGPAGSQVSPPDPEFGHPVVSPEAPAGFFLFGSPGSRVLSFGSRAVQAERLADLVELGLEVRAGIRQHPVQLAEDLHADQAVEPGPVVERQVDRSGRHPVEVFRLPPELLDQDGPQ